MIERPVTIDGLAGTLSLPNTSGAVPCVLLLHGFGSQKDEVGNLYRRLAAALSEQAIASLRIDFRGWGESAGDMASTTIVSQLDDTGAATAYLETLSSIDSTRLGVVGFSLGAAIAILAAARNPHHYDSIVLWSPMGDLEADFRKSLGTENFVRAQKEGIVTIDLGWRFVTLKDAFFAGLDDYDLQQGTKNLTAPLMAIAGSEDASVGPAKFIVENAQSMAKEVIIVEDADHIFNVLSDDQTCADQVIQTTVDWFERTL